MPKSKAHELALFAQHLNSNGNLNAITMSVDGLVDVDTTTTAPTNGQTLVWDGNNFVPGAGGGGGGSSNTNEVTEGTDNSVGESTLGAADGTNNLYYTDARVDARIALQVGASLDLSGKSTSDLSEGTNLYYTDARADARIAATTSDSVSEGSTNLYFTAERVDDRVNQLLVAGTNIGLSYDDANNTFTINSDNTGGYNLANNNLADLGNVSATAPSTGEVLKWNGSAWAPATDATAGGGGLDADTLDGQDGTYYLNYNNFTNTPTLFNGAFSSLTGRPTTISGYGITDAFSGAYADLSGKPTLFDNTAFDTRLGTKSTDDLSEGSTNKYYTDAKADARATLRINAATTDNISEGSTNLYFTNTRADARISAASITALSDADQTVRTTDNVTFNNITTTGYIAGPASFTIDPAAVGDNTGTVIIAGDLQVDGTTTTINSTTLDVDDLNITVAKGAANAGAANGAGLTVDGASATLTYVNPGDNWAFNKPLDMGSNNITTTGKILYSNVYSAEGDLPNAGTYHGMFAHVHGTGKGYFAHAGAWIKLLDESSSSTSNLSEGTNLYYTNARADARITLQVGANLDLSSKSTSDLSEGTNLYYTDSRVDTHLNQGSAGSNQVLSWNGSDYAWVAQTTGYGDSNVDTHLNTSTASTNEVLAWNGSDYDWVAQSGGIALTSLSVGAEATAAGDGAIAYNNSTGVFTYTPPILSGLSGDTDDISEGSNNQYFTSARVQAENLGGSLAGTISDAKMQYATSYSGTAVQGSFFFDSLNAKVKVYNGSAFVDAVPAGGGGGGGGATDANTTFRKYIYTTSSATNSVSGKDDEVVTAGNFVVGYQYEIISAGTTNFVSIGAANNNVGTTFTATGTGSGTGTAGHVLNYATNGTENIEVFVNGIKQVEGASNDYVATTGTSVNFVSNFASGDVVDIQVYELLTNSAYYTKTETYTQAEVNSQITTAVGGNLTLTGLTVDTDTLKVDESNNRVGIGTATPGAELHVEGDTFIAGQIKRVTGLSFGPFGAETSNFSGGVAGDLLNVGSNSGTHLKVNIGGSGAILRSSSGDEIRLLSNNSTTVNGIVVASDGNVGIGTDNPIADLSIVDSATGTGIEIQPEIATDENRITNYDRAESAYKKFRLDASEHNFYISGTNKVTFNSSGYVGIGTDAPTVGLDMYGSGNVSRIKLRDSSAHQLNIGLWDGSNHRIEGDANRPILITSYNSNGVQIGGSGANNMQVSTGGVDFMPTSSGAFNFKGGGGNQLSIKTAQYTGGSGTSIGTSNIQIVNSAFGALVFVAGYGNGQFCDLVYFGYNASPTIIAQQTIVGSPPTRYYTGSGYALYLRYSSGSLTTKVNYIQSHS